MLRAAKGVTGVCAVSAAAVIGVWLGYHLLGAAVDNRLGIFIDRDIRAVRTARVGDETIDDLVKRRYGQVVWSGWHREEVWRTFVECQAPSIDGQGVRLVWEVNRGYSPARGEAADGVYVFALTRDAGALAPPYIPHGLVFSDLPSVPSMTATALHGLIAKRRVGDRTLP